MKPNQALLLIAAFFLSVPVQADDSTIMLKWSSIPNQMQAHEVYIRNDKVLYIVSTDTVEVTRKEAVPEWLTKEINQAELINIAKALKTIADERIKAKKRFDSENKSEPLCHGFVWRLDVNVDENNVQYSANCDPEYVREKVQRFVKSVVGDPLIQDVP